MDVVFVEEPFEFFGLQELRPLIRAESFGYAKNLKDVSLDKFDGLFGVDGAPTRYGEPEPGVWIQDGEERILAVVTREADDEV